MAPTTKRKRGAVSYKEPSSDEDLSDSSVYERTPRRERPAPSRRSARQQAHDDDSNQHTTPEPSPAPEPSRRQQKVPRTRRHRKVTYKDISSDEEEDPDADFEFPEEYITRPPQRRAKATAVPSPRPQRSGRPKERGRPKQRLGMSTLTDPTHSVTDLATLVKSLNTLREIDIFDPMDRPPFRPRLRRVRRWIYPDELFAALRETELRLRSWRWNSTFCQRGPLWMKGIHGDDAFQSLRDLTLVKYHPEPSREEEDEDEGNPEPTMEELIGSALAVLPKLRSLAFETCGIVRKRLLPLLPTNLTSLSIVNCGEILSDALSSFLATHGAHLEELTLHHNQALDLSFLVDLKQSCPRLEVLRMDTTYYSSLVMSSDNEPLYEALLGENEVPTWPSTLRILDMQYLRKWDSTAASNFFQSLIDSAAELPHLQDLTIIAMVDTDWRQRAEFRRKWSATFQAVFARRWEPPKPHLASFKAYRLWKERHPKSKQEAPHAGDEKVDSFIEGVSEEPAELQTAGESDSDAPLVSRRKKQDEQWGSTRLRSRAKANAGYDEESDEPGSEQEAEDEEQVSFVQGRCHTVIFRIDNFRPREEIYAEADFLDAEPSGDDEWNGNDEAADEGGYAW
ncbi:hypothetical protein SLS59_002434 [Nothophoma quercina]|uniref:Uncharacterized protein n=1 Tax=Nothophoma quercina TaxID=749835 RepID=A0ABR3RSQ1_9PLEO